MKLKRVTYLVRDPPPKYSAPDGTTLELIGSLSWPLDQMKTVNVKSATLDVQRECRLAEATLARHDHLALARV